MIFLTTVTTVQYIYVYIYFLSNFGKSNWTYLTTDVIFSGQCFAILAMFSLDVWQSYFAHTFCQIHFTLFCCKFTFFLQFTHFFGYYSFGSNLACVNKSYFSMSVKLLPDIQNSIHPVPKLTLTLYLEQFSSSSFVIGKFYCC